MGAPLACSKGSDFGVRTAQGDPIAEIDWIGARDRNRTGTAV